jgi:hypothetical protein
VIFAPDNESVAGLSVREVELWLKDQLGDPHLQVRKVEPCGDGHSGDSPICSPFTVRRRGANSSCASLRRVCVLSPTRTLAGRGESWRRWTTPDFLCPGVLLSDSSGSLGGGVAIMERIDGIGWAQARQPYGDRFVMQSAVDASHDLSRLAVDAVGISGEPAAAVASTWLAGRGSCSGPPRTDMGTLPGYSPNFPRLSDVRYLRDHWRHRYRRLGSRGLGGLRFASAWAPTRSNLRAIAWDDLRPGGRWSAAIAWLGR